MPKLNKRIIDAAQPGPGERFVWDDELRGFGLRVFPSGRKTFFIQYRDRVHARTRRYVLGTYGVLTPAEARALAVEALADVQKGGDPSETRRLTARAPTVGDLCSRYLSDYAEGRKKPRSLAEDKRLIEDFVNQSVVAQGGLRASPGRRAVP